MKLFNKLILIIPLVALISCTAGSSEEQTEETAEEVNEEMKTSEFAEQDAEFVVEAYSYNMMLQEYGAVVLNSINVPEKVKEYAQQSVDYHEQLNSDLERAASANNIVLPVDVGENVIEFKEELREKEGTELAEDYLEVVDDIQRKMISEYQDALLNVTDPQLHDWVKLTSAKIAEREEIVDQLQEYNEEID